MWSVEVLEPSAVTLTLLSPDGDQGFPGALSVSLRYSIEAEGTELWLRYRATTTRPTPVSLTNHAYFNLGSGTVSDHTLHLLCSGFNPDDGSGSGLPTGEHRSVKGTARDASGGPTRVGSLIEGQASDTPLWPHGEQMVADAMRGRDPNAVAEEGDGSLAALPLLATLAHPPSGRALRVFSSEPVVQTCVAATATVCALPPWSSLFTLSSALSAPQVLCDASRRDGSGEGRRPTAAARRAVPGDAAPCQRGERGRCGRLRPAHRAPGAWR